MMLGSFWDEGRQNGCFSGQRCLYYDTMIPNTRSTALRSTFVTRRYDTRVSSSYCCCCTPTYEVILYPLHRRVCRVVMHQVQQTADSRQNRVVSRQDGFDMRLPRAVWLHGTKVSPGFRSRSPLHPEPDCRHHVHICIYKVFALLYIRSIIHSLLLEATAVVLVAAPGVLLLCACSLRLQMIVLVEKVLLQQFEYRQQ